MEINFFFLFMTSVFLCYHLSAGVDENFSKFHLPGLINPLKYELTVHTDPNDANIEHWGDVRITIQCTKETKQIVVNRESLEIEELEVKVNELINKKDEGEVVEIAGPNYDLKNDRYIIELKENLEKDKTYVVTIPFFKKSENNLPDFPSHGLIKRTYKSEMHPNYLKPLVYTKMGRIDARGIFPSLDQINIKTPFRIKLGHPESMRAFSNANLDFQEAIPGKPDWTLDVFEETVAMTTYSVTMALLKFVSKNTTESSSKVEIRVWSDVAVVELIDYVFPVAFHSLKFYFDLFKVPYGFKKLDVVILPDELIKVWGSYGLIILSQEYVMKTIERSRTEFEMVSKFSRAISQQWIGYRVTMDWWDQNWLHRGLNRFLQSVCVNQILPEWEFSYSAWDIVDSFVKTQKNEIKGMYNPILTLEEFPNGSLESENAETQEKIYQLIRMTDFLLGSKVFRERIKTYVDTFEFANSGLTQVWEAFGRTPIIKKDNDISESFSVQEVLETWLSQRGVPLMDVKQDYDTKYITVTQEPFVSLQLDEEKTKNIEKPSWIIPLSYTTQRELNFKNIEIRGWLTPKQPLVIHVDDMKREQWIILNLQLNVLGHVNYNPDNWKAIQNYLLNPKKYSLFDIETRVRFIHDIFALAEAEKLPYTFLFNTMNYLKHETHDLPLRVALDEFDILYSRLLRSDRMHKLLKTYVRNILTPFYEKEFISLDLVTFLESEFVDYRRKILIVGASCRYGVIRCADSARNLQNSWSIDELPKKPRELRKIVLCEAVKYTSKYVPSALITEYERDQKKPNDWAEDIIDALCCSVNENIIQNVLKASLNNDRWYWKDRFRVFKSLSTNAEAYELMKTFFKNNYVTIRKLNSNNRTIASLFYLKILIEMTKTTTEIQELTDFATSVQLNWKTLEIEETIVNAKKKILWSTSFRKYTDENSRDLRN